MKLRYWIKFPNLAPFLITAANFKEFMGYIECEVQRHGKPFDWLQSD